jgi:hypothetical protein
MDPDWLSTFFAGLGNGGGSPAWPTMQDGNMLGGLGGAPPAGMPPPQGFGAGGNMLDPSTMNYKPPSGPQNFAPPTPGDQSQPNSLGAALDPTGGADTFSNALGAGNDALKKATGNSMPGLTAGLSELRGLTTPKPPDVVKPTSPSLPQMGAIKPDVNQFLSLMQMLSNPQMQNMKTLGQSLGVGRY